MTISELKAQAGLMVSLAQASWAVGDRMIRELLKHSTENTDDAGEAITDEVQRIQDGEYTDTSGIVSTLLACFRHNTIEEGNDIAMPYCRLDGSSLSFGIKSIQKARSWKHA